MTTKVPLQGLASKILLVHEWETASIGQKDAALRVLCSKTIDHLRDLKKSVPVAVTGAAKFQAARMSLESLLCILHQQARQQADHGISVDTFFTCAFEEAVINPQAAVIKLLLAEHLQEQCSLLLCERLSKEEEIAVALSMSVSVAFSNTVGTTNDGTKAKIKCANHSQRRRASRKRMLELRRREVETRALQRKRFSCVLRELRDHCCQKQEKSVACVDKILLDVIDTAVDDDQLTSGRWNISTERCIKNNGQPRQKRKKKKTKREKGKKKNDR